MWRGLCFCTINIQKFYFTIKGCRSSPVNMEARPVDAKMITRRCIVARLKEVSISKYRDLIQENAGALLVLLPSDLGSISKEDKQVGFMYTVLSAVHYFA